MLLKMRGGLDSLFVTALLGLLIASFAIWGIGPGLLGGNQAVIAEVGSQTVETQRFFRAVQNRATDIQAQIGGSMATTELIQTFQLDRSVLNEMVAEAAIAAEADRLGLAATREQIVEALLEIDGFKAPDGSLDRTFISFQLNSIGMTESQLEDDISKAVVRDHMLRSLVAANPVPGAVAKELQVLRGERRDLTLISIGSDVVGDFEDPDADELATWYELRKDDYASPDLRSYRYVLVTPDHYKSNVEVSEEEIAAEYDRRSSEFIDPELRDVLQVTVSDLATAEVISAAVAAGEDFATVAAANSSFTVDEIALGDQSRGDIEDGFGDDAAAAVFALGAGTLSAPIEAFGNYTLFFVSEVTPGSEQALDEVRDQLVAGLIDDKAVTALFDQQGEIEDAIADDPVLETVAERFGLTVASVSDVSRQGRDRDGNQRLSTQAEYRILSQAYAQSVDDEPDALPLDDRDSQVGFFMVTVDTVTEPAERPLGEVRNRVLTDWRAEKSKALAAEQAEIALAKLREGQAATDVIEETGGTSFNATNVARVGAEGSGVSANIRRLAFELQEGGSELEASADGDGYVIVRVDAVKPGNQDDADAINAIRAELNQLFLQDMLLQYQGYLLKKYPASINEVVLRTLFDQANAG